MRGISMDTDNYGYSVVTTALCVNNYGISMDTHNYGYSVVALTTLHVCVNNYGIWYIHGYR